MSTPSLTLEQEPTVSVGMPAYNSAAWIGAAIESILGQSWRNLELIISDNASTDATFAICERYAQQDARVRLYRNTENIGANRNYMAVLQLARAPYFKWASSNDLCAPTFIEKCVLALEADPQAVLALPKTALFQSDASDAQPYDHDVLLTAAAGSERLIEMSRTIRLNNVFNAVIRTRQLRGAAPLGNYLGSDFPLMAELALMGKFLLVPEQLFFRRMSPEAATKLKSAREVDQHIEPRAARPLKWQRWRFYLALLRAVARQRPITRDSFAAFRYVMKRIRWARNHLARDMLQAWSREGW
jgi:glycosyltransferase involved in cell wall biosynthesis